MIAAYLRRGLAAGLLAALLAGVFAFAFGEPQVDRVIALEEQADSAHAHGAAPQHDSTGMVELSRSTQKVGLFFATGLSGCFLGGMFGIAFAFFRERLGTRSDWSSSLSLAAALFVGAVLLPFLKYPANPQEWVIPQPLPAVRAPTSRWLPSRWLQCLRPGSPPGSLGSEGSVSPYAKWWLEWGSQRP